MKKFLSMLLVLMLALSLVACGTKTEGEAGTEGEGETVEPLSVCFITQQLGDNSFADAADRSMKSYADTYGVEYQCTQLGGNGDAITASREAGQNGFDIVAVQYDAEVAAMLDAEAGDYPDTIFYMFSAPNTYTPAAANVVSGYFRSCESSYMGGIVAGHVTTTGVAAFVGGMESTGLYDWMFGYVQGVKLAGSNSVYSWIGGDNPWSDPAKAKELSMALYNNYNADTFWGCAGQSGDGVFEAVRELRDNTGSDAFWALGVDADQHAIFAANGKDDIADLILTSCMKNPVGPVESFIQTLQAGGTVEGGMLTVGAAQNACVIAENDFYLANAPQAAQEAVAAAKADLVAGTSSVITAYGMTNDEINTFLQEYTLNYVASTLA